MNLEAPTFQPPEEKPRSITPLPTEQLNEILQEDTEQTTPFLEAPTQLTEEAVHSEVPKAQREEQRLNQIDEIRRELGMPSEIREPAVNVSAEESKEILKKADLPFETSGAKEEPKEIKSEMGLEQKAKEEKKKEYHEKEDIKDFSNSTRMLAERLNQLSNTIARNKLPRVSFESNDVTKVSTSEEHINQKGIQRGLDDIMSKISKIRMPEDRKDMMALEPHNIRAVIGGMENMGGDLLKLKGVFERARSGDYTELAKSASRVLSRLRSKTEGFHDAISALQRYKGR